MDDPAQSSALFEFEVDGAGEPASSTTGTSSAAPSSTPASPSPSPRLSYLLSGPGTSDGWEPVPEVASDEWAVVVQNSTEGRAADAGGGGDGGGGDGGGNVSGIVWGLSLEDLGDGEYRLQVGVGRRGGRRGERGHKSHTARSVAVCSVVLGGFPRGCAAISISGTEVYCRVYLSRATRPHRRVQHDPSASDLPFHIVAFRSSGKL